MIERVARAIMPWAWENGRPSLEGERIASLIKARAAIKIMREPTAEMKQAVAADWGRKTWRQYQAMIDSILDDD